MTKREIEVLEWQNEIVHETAVLFVEWGGKLRLQENKFMLWNWEIFQLEQRTRIIESDHGLVCGFIAAEIERFWICSFVGWSTELFAWVKGRRARTWWKMREMETEEEEREVGEEKRHFKKWSRMEEEQGKCLVIMAFTIPLLLT